MINFDGRVVNTKYQLLRFKVEEEREDKTEFRAEQNLHLYESLGKLYFLSAYIFLSNFSKVKRAKSA